MDANVFFVLLVSGIAFSHAQSTCSEDEYDGCDKLRDWKIDRVPETQYDMDEFCRSEMKVSKCALEIVERCPDATFRNDAVEQYTRNQLLCDRNKSYRNKFIENASCYHDTAVEMYNLCPKSYGYTHEEKCKYLKSYLDCVVEANVKNCGEDVREFTTIIHNPEYQLRQAKCI